MNGSILYRGGAEYSEFDADVFRDLRIDAILGEIAGGEGGEAVRALYLRKPARREDAEFRLAVMKDLERPDVREVVEAFTVRYGQYRTYLGYSRTLPQRQTRQKWLLDAACAYCGCLEDLRRGLEKAAPESEGLRRFAGCLGEYMDAGSFGALRGDAERCAGALGSVRYTLDVWLYQNRVAVRTDGSGGSDDYCARLEDAFSRFGLAPGPRMVPFPGVNMESLELAVLDRLGELCPEEFRRLGGFCERHPDVGSELAGAFAAELEFYLTYIAYMSRMKENGYAFSCPVFHERSAMAIRGGYDASLAVEQGPGIAANDFAMEEGENFVVTGANRSGKTAYARMVGQVAFFASLGLPAPCLSAEMHFVGGIFTHFAREEDLSTNYGRLKEELQRAKRILDAMPPGSIVLFNDLFSSTTSFDALEIGKRLLGGLARYRCLCLFATNFHELAGSAPNMIRLHAARDDEAGGYRVTREPAGKPHAGRCLTDRRLGYDDIRSRIK